MQEKEEEKERQRYPFICKIFGYSVFPTGAGSFSVLCSGSVLVVPNRFVCVSV